MAMCLEREVLSALVLLHLDLVSLPPLGAEISPRSHSSGTSVVILQAIAGREGSGRMLLLTNTSCLSSSCSCSLAPLMVS